jgi:hypothetical protein
MWRMKASANALAELESFPGFDELAAIYGVPLRDVHLMALNLYGVSSSFGDGRARIKVRLDSDPGTEWHLIVPTGRSDSDFELVGDTLLLEGERIAYVRLWEHDDARLGYARSQGQVFTMNTNRRSTCTGCVFCPNTLADANDPRLARKEDEIEGWIKALLLDNGWPDLSHVREINLSTGCFGEEALALQHLRMLRALLDGFGFTGRLGILTSVIRTPKGMRALAEIGPFCLFLTLECITRRELLLKESKANLDPAAAIDVLRFAREAGIDTGVMIVIGLDSLPVVYDWLGKAAPYLTDFPNLQIFQSHTSYMDLFRVPGAGTLEFFLDARNEIERILLPTALRPRSWQNYRPLWHYRFGPEELPL